MKGQRLPGWLCTVFVAGMLALTLLLAWYAPVQYALRFQIDDVALSLDTSRQREAKQLYEYDEVVHELPITQEELDQTLPLTQAAQALEKELRATRKALRAQAAELETQLAQQLAEVDALTAQRDALLAEVEALRAQEASLRQAIELAE
ncbi:MAG: hypothetical protein ACI4MJ_10935 [Aristaeellaceae bacterium]